MFEDIGEGSDDEWLNQYQQSTASTAASGHG
jgi:hypothetical protein